MKRVLLIIYALIVITLLVNFFCYRELYNNQINYITKLLDRQAQLVGLSIDNTNNGFLSDFNQISIDEDLRLFFISETHRHLAIERLKLFLSKYNEFVVGIRLYDNQQNEFTLKRDPDTNQWLEQSFMLHNQGEIIDKETFVEKSNIFDYYLPLVNNNIAVGNIVATIDYKSYFSAVFTAFNLKDYQWQWVLSDSGKILFDNVESPVKYNQLNNIIKGIREGGIGHIVHSASIDGKNRKIISAYYSAQLLQRELGVVFSTYTDFFQKYIIRNSLFIFFCSLSLELLMIMLLLRFIKLQDKTISQLNASEKLLFKLIEEMPVGIIIHNKNREIIKANSVAAKHYSCDDENEMTGKIFPATPSTDVNRYLSKELNSEFSPEQFIVIKKEIGEVVLYRNSLPITLKGEDATLEILFDVTMFETEKKNEAKDIAQSEFFTRMSYEVRTPLNGIIGMTDMLAKHKLSDEVTEITTLLRQSSEILLNIVNDLFDLSKIESGSIILDEVLFNLRNELNYCVAQAKKSISANVKFYCNIDDNVPKNIVGDQFRLRQVLINLINHSIANTNEGKIHLDCKLKKTEYGGTALIFTLADTGILFNKASINKVFGEYLKFDINNVKINDNTVFGAIIAKNLVEIMGGELHAESPSGLVENKGLKITFSIPSLVNTNKNVDIRNITTFENIRALAITGTQNRAEETINDLHKIGIDLKVTAYQKFTINQIQSNLSLPDEKYNLIIIFDSDNLDGFEVASNIWENNLSENFIQFLITTKDKKGNHSKCVTMGVDQYLIKPFEITELIQTIKTCFPEIAGKPILPKSVDKSEMKILIVEDNPMAQKIMESILKFLGYNFETASDGSEAYKKVLEQKYDLIILDMALPKMDGFELSRRVIEHDKDSLIIAVSANYTPEMIEKSKLVGIKEFLPKPIRIEDLKKILVKYFKKVI